MPHSTRSTREARVKAEARRSSGLGPKMLQQKTSETRSSRLSRKRMSYALDLAQLQEFLGLLSAAGWVCLSSAREVCLLLLAKLGEGGLPQLGQESSSSCGSVSSSMLAAQGSMLSVSGSMLSVPSFTSSSRLFSRSRLSSSKLFSCFRSSSDQGLPPDARRC